MGRVWEAGGLGKWELSYIIRAREWAESTQPGGGPGPIVGLGVICWAVFGEGSSILNAGVQDV